MFSNARNLLAVATLGLLLAIAGTRFRKNQMAPPVQSFRLPDQIFNATLISRVLGLWFENMPHSARAAPTETLSMWFGLGERADFDIKCRATSIDALEAIGPARMSLPPFTTHAEDRRAAMALSAPFRGMAELRSEDWDTRAKAGLALVILLDQMPRNAFREQQAKIYSHYDRLARALVHSIMHPPERQDGDGRHLHGLHRGAAGWELSLARRMWFFMPLMHSEDIADHDEFTAKMTELKQELLADGDGETAAEIDKNLEFESKHREIIEQFGRYPYRNAVLGRENTPEEQEWMKTGESFGARM